MVSGRFLRRAGEKKGREEMLRPSKGLTMFFILSSFD